MTKAGEYSPPIVRTASPAEVPNVLKRATHHEEGHDRWSRTSTEPARDSCNPGRGNPTTNGASDPEQGDKKRRREAHNKQATTEIGNGHTDSSNTPATEEKSAARVQTPCSRGKAMKTAQGRGELSRNPESQCDGNMENRNTNQLINDIF